MFRQLRALRLVTVISVLNRQLRDDVRGRVAVYVASTVTLVGFVAAIAVLDAERDAPDASITTFGDAVWWTLTTISTVGYGDRYPVTLEGRCVAAALMVAGIALLGVVTASIASWFVENLRRAGEQVAEDVEEVAEDVERSRPSWRPSWPRCWPSCARSTPGWARWSRARPSGPAPLSAGPPVVAGPIRSSAALMSASDRSAWVISRTRPAIGAARTPAALEPAQRALQVGHRDQHDVGLRGRDLPAALAQPGGQRAGPLVVLGQPVDAVQRDQPGRGQHPALADAAAEHLAQPAGLARRTRPSRRPATRPGRRGPCSGTPERCRRPTVSAPGGTPSATAACHSRAPSRCTRSFAARAAAATATCSSGAVTVPPAALCVFSRQSSVVRSV